MINQDEDKFLVITGNEFGYDLGNMVETNFLNIDDAEMQYDKLLEEYGCASMWLVTPTHLKPIKEEAEF
jgi:hypothetical protein